MLFSKLRQIITGQNKPYITNNITTARYLPRRRYGWFNVVLFTVNKSQSFQTMSRSLKFRHFWRDLNVVRLWSVWTRSYTLSSVVKRCRRERGVRDVFLSVRQTLFRSRRTLLLSATAAYKNSEDSDDQNVPCNVDISDDELEALISDLEGVDELSRLTLYCTSCGRRLAIDKRYDGVRYCSCKVPTSEIESHDGWVPYMEAHDVVIWRKEYKSGQRYAYKVYGRYHEVVARDFAGVHVDGRYRRAWDAAVAALCVVEEDANGVRDQAVLHWEVMWPRMFSNRDYVYIRRHKQFEAPQTYSKHKDSLFKEEEPKTQLKTVAERPSVHSHAKRKTTMESEIEENGNKVYVILSRSCVHEKVPEAKHAVRVKDYFSHMVVKSLYGCDKPGMEFVLTYYDDAGGGGLPGGVTAWATGRAAPAYLARMRRAANDYHTSQDHFEPDLPFKNQSTQTENPGLISAIEKSETILTNPLPQPTLQTTNDGTPLCQTDVDKDSDVDSENGAKTEIVVMKTPEVKEAELPKELAEILGVKEENIVKKEEIKDDKVKNEDKVKKDEIKEIETKVEDKEQSPEVQTKPEDVECQDEKEANSSWWRYLYPFYYFL